MEEVNSKCCDYPIYTYTGKKGETIKFCSQCCLNITTKN